MLSWRRWCQNADVAARADADERGNTIRSLLPAGEWRRYLDDPERDTLTRLLRAVELGGHDIDDVLRRAVQRRDFAGAESIAAVLHGRVRLITGTPEAQPGSSYADRTPVIENPEAARFAQELAVAMDDRMALLGNRAAADRPVWALRYLGEVPADPIDRAEWIQRVAPVAAYREERGYSHETDPIGPAPDRGSPEQRVSWHAAWTALGMPAAGRDVATATYGELWAWRAAYERDAAWAPRYVVGELREAHIAEDSYRADAVLARHRADAAADRAERDRARRQAGECSALAQEIGAYREALTEIVEARRRWYAATDLDRQRAVRADAELRRRHPATDLAPLSSDEELVAEAVVEPGADHAAGDAARPLRLVGQDVSAALEAARRAEKVIAGRERADRESDLASDDLMRRRDVEAQQEAAARRSAVR